MKRTIDELIKEFAETQNKLCQSVIKEYDLIADSDVVFKTPMTGSLILNGAQWTFRRHGLGLRFINHESGYVIDAHRNFVTSPSGFDAWRLMQFFETISAVDADLKSKTGGLDSEAKINELLSSLVDQGSIEPVGNSAGTYVEKFK